MRLLATTVLFLAALTLFTPACSSTTCSSVDVDTTGADCRVTIDTCSDGHVYRFACADGKCACTIDGAASDVTPTATDCAADSVTHAQEQCEWDLQVFQET